MAGKRKGDKGTQRHRYLGDKKVQAVLYVGKHGRYMSGRTDEELITDEAGKPLVFQQIGELR
jgi:hypothetical protein